MYGKTGREHNLTLSRILQHLQGCGFFGVIFSAQGFVPTQDQTTTLLNATRPTTMAEVKLFLDMVNFSVYFIPEFSSKTALLRALTMKNTKFMIEQM